MHQFTVQVLLVDDENADDWSNDDFSDFCRLATSLLKYTCSIIVGI